jgi:uncharacterized membrane protein
MSVSTIWTKLREPHVAFAILAAIFGLVYVFLIPPMWGQDEHGHYRRAEAISRGDIGTQQLDENHAFGGPINDKVLDFINEHFYLRVDHLSDGTELTFPYAPQQSYPDDADGYSPSAYSAYAVYPPTVYLPQSLGIAVGRLLTHDIYLESVFARIFGLIAFIALGCLAIKKMPFGKWFMFAVLLLPSTVFQSAMVSADCLTTAIVLLFIAFCLDVSFMQRAVKNKDLVILALLVLLLASVKISYVLLAFLVLMIPLVRKDFRSPKKLALLAIPVAAAGVVSLIWMSSISQINPNDWTKSWSDYQAQKGDISGFVTEFIRSIALSSGNSNLVGVSFHASGSSFAWYFDILAIIALTLAALSGSASEALVHKLKKGPLYGLVAGILALTIVAMNYAIFTAFTPNAADTIDIQSRYLIPLLPLFFLPLLLIPTAWTSERKRGITCFVVAAVSLVLVASVVWNYQLIY